MKATKLTVLDLFSGIGGFTLGLERAGFQTVAFCEIKDYPSSILKKHWPDIPNHGDIRTLNGKCYEKKIDLICGGFPCQPYSVAGKQKGESDDRYLWPQMLRIICEVKPCWVICENVTGFIAMGLDNLLFDLEAQGYITQSFVIPACAVGASHKRERLWIFGYAEHFRRDGTQKRQGYQQRNQRPAKRAEKIKQSAGSGGTWSFDPAIIGTGYGGESDLSRQWEPIRVSTQPQICHRNDGVPDRVARLRALGNAVIPQIPELFGRAILGVDNAIN